MRFSVELTQKRELIMRERLAEERIIKAIKCHGTGDKFSYLNRELMISTGTVYTRFSKYLGLEVN